METVGLIGIGKIGLPIAENLIKNGYRVLGYRRSAMADFEPSAESRHGSPAEIGAQTDIVLTCLPSAKALDEVVQGKQRSGAIRRGPGRSWSSSARIRFPTKERQIAPLAAKGATSSTARSSGTPGMVQQRKGVIYLAGNTYAAKKVERVARAISDIVHLFRRIRRRQQGQARSTISWSAFISRPLPRRWRWRLRAGVDVDLMIKAIAAGSGGSTQFGIRAPWMAQRRFLPAQGDASAFSHYFD